jgi:hypothetical protein
VDRGIGGTAKCLMTANEAKRANQDMLLFAIQPAVFLVIMA